MTTEQGHDEKIMAMVVEHEPPIDTDGELIEHLRSELAAATTHIAELEAERGEDRSALERGEDRSALERAQITIAQMHEAAVGEARGPIRGVVEDVEDLRLCLQGAVDEVEALRKVNAEAVARAVALEHEALRADISPREPFANHVAIMAALDHVTAEVHNLRASNAADVTTRRDLEHARAYIVVCEKRIAKFKANTKARAKPAKKARRK